jgi:enoyl-CoA hydratase/carnithine racemase
VNSLSLDFLTEFVISLEKLENDKTFRGVILTSVGAIWSPESLEKSWR